MRVALALALVATALLLWRLRGPDTVTEKLGLQRTFDDLREGSGSEGAFPLYASFREPPSERMGAVRTYLRTGTGKQQAQAVLDTVDFSAIEAICAHPKLAPNYDWERPTRFDLTWIGRSLRITELLAARALTAAQAGRVESCAQDLRRIVVVTDHLSELGVVITYMVRERALLALSNCVTAVCEAFDANGAALRAVFDATARLEECSSRDALRHELAMGLATIGELARGEISIEDLSKGSVALTHPPPRFETAIIASNHERFKSAYEHDFIELAKAWGDYNALSAAMDAYNSRPLDLSDTVGVQIQAVNTILMPLFDGAYSAEASNQVYIRAIKLGAAAYVQKSKSGEWPSLEEAANLAGVGTDDPFGGTLRFVPSSQLLIYSVYRDGTDQGGNPRRQYDSGPFDKVGFGRYTGS